MAHYAFLDENNIVTQIIVGKDEGDFDWENYYESQKGQVCKRTSYNTLGGVHKLGGTPFRKNYACIGFKYDQQRDAFIPIKEFDSWVLNEETCLWEAPIAPPNDGKHYRWNEETKNWNILPEPSY
jgi:hypothetical protein